MRFSERFKNGSNRPIIMAMDPAPTTTAAPTAASATPAAAATAKPAEAETDFTKKLAAELQRIASHATKVETLKNGAKLYHLAGGREVEAAPGKSPYVVKQGDWGEKKAATTPAAPATTAPTTAPPAAAPPTTATTTPPATAATPPATATTTPPATTPTTGTK